MAQFYDIKSIILPHDEDELHIKCGTAEIEDGAVTDDKLSPAGIVKDVEGIGNTLSEFWIPGKNIFNPNTENKRASYYVKYDTGALIYNASQTCYVVPVTGGANISVNQRYAHVAFSADPNLSLPDAVSGHVISGYISGVTESTVIEGAQVPASARVMVLSIATSQEASTQVEYGDHVTQYEQYSAGIDGAKILPGTIPEDRIIDSSPVTLSYTLAADGTGDFSTLRACLEAIAAASYASATVKLGPGTYDVRSMYTSEEWNVSEFVGLRVPRGTALVGTGRDRSEVLITCTSEIRSDKISALNITDDVSMRNLTVYGNNVRYVVHDDYSDYYLANDSGSSRRMADVDFIGEELIYDMVYGAGTQGGADWLFERCRFIQSPPGLYEFSVHDRYTQSQTFSILPEIITFRDCQFVGSENSVRLCPGNGKVSETVAFEHCMMGGVYVSSQFTGGMNSTTVYKVIGSGNSADIEFSYYNDHDRLTIPMFSDVVRAGVNSEQTAISAGGYCKETQAGIVIGTQADNDGTALNSAEPGSVVYYAR